MEKIRAVQRVSVLQFTRLEAWTRKNGNEGNMKIFTAFLVCISIIPLLSGCLTFSLWDQGIVHRIPERKITVSGNEVCFQAKETIRYPFLPFHWTTEQNMSGLFRTEFDFGFAF